MKKVGLYASQKLEVGWHNSFYRGELSPVSHFIDHATYSLIGVITYTTSRGPLEYGLDVVPLLPGVASERCFSLGIASFKME